MLLQDSLGAICRRNGCHDKIIRALATTRKQRDKAFYHPPRVCQSFMGSGASKAPHQRQSLRHSDSRVFDLAALAQKPATDIVYINSPLQDWVTQRRPRARSLPELSGDEVLQQIPHQSGVSEKPALDENSASEPTPAVITPLVIVLSPPESTSPSSSGRYKLDSSLEAVIGTRMKQFSVKTT